MAKGEATNMMTISGVQKLGAGEQFVVNPRLIGFCHVHSPMEGYCCNQGVEVLDLMKGTQRMFCLQ